MPIDFSAAVLGPCMNAFARECTWYPKASQSLTVSTDAPYGVPYKRRAIFTSVSFDVQLLDGQPFSDQKTELGIKIDDFTVGDVTAGYLAVPVPARDDRVVVPNAGVFVVSDTSIDGQGGMKLQLRRPKPAEALVALP